jgi:hypothetical protein
MSSDSAEAEIILRGMDAKHARIIREELLDAGIKDEIIEYDWRRER